MGLHCSLTHRAAGAVIRAVDSFYAGPWRSIVPLQTFRYGVCGAATYFVFDPAAYFVIYNYIVAKHVVHLGPHLALSPEIASLAAVFPLTFAVGFWLNRNVAFRRSPLRTRIQLIRYALSIAGSIALNYVLMKLFVVGMGFWPTPSKVLVSAVCAVYSYLAAKYFTFRHAPADGFDKSARND